MDSRWLLENLRRSWKHRCTALDFAKRLVWTYSAKMPRVARRERWEIGFRYRAPIGKLRLVVRDNFGSDAFILGEVFEHEYYSLPLDSAPSTILDLGSNAGFSAVYFGKTYPQASLACVEPAPGNLESLRSNLQANAIRARIFAGAVDVGDGEVRIQLSKKDFGHKVVESDVGAGSDQIRVLGLSMDTILQELSWERVGLLKVDIEGHEGKLLTESNSWLNRVDAICIECHEEMPEETLREVARRFGFRPPVNHRGIWLLSRGAEPAAIPRP